MPGGNSELLSQFIDWANSCKMRCRFDVAVEVELGPPHDKQMAFIKFEDESSAADITVWDSGGLEFEYLNVLNDKLNLWKYEENIDASKLDEVCRPLLAKYLRDV